MARKKGFEALAANLETVRPITLDTYVVRPYNSELDEFSTPGGNTYLVRSSSYNHKIDPSKKNVASCMLVRFGEHYMVNGLCIFMEGDLKPEMCNQFPKEHQDLCREKIKTHRGRRVYFMKDVDEIGRFFDNRMHPQAITDDDEPVPKPDNILMLLSEDKPPMLLNDECEIFRDPSNPFYITRGGDEIGERALSFITQNVIADDVIDYIADRKMLPSAFLYASQGKRVGKAIVQNNLAFLMRFCRVPGYDFSSDYELSAPLILQG